MWKKVTTIIGAILLLSTFAGVVIGFQSKVATKADIAAVQAEVTVKVGAISERLTRHELEQMRSAVQQRIWNMEDRWAERFLKKKSREHTSLEELVAFMSEEDRSSYRDLVERLKKIDEQIKAVNDERET